MPHCGFSAEDSSTALSMTRFLSGQDAPGEVLSVQVCFLGCVPIDGVPRAAAGNEAAPKAARKSVWPRGREGPGPPSRRRLARHSHERVKAAQDPADNAVAIQLELDALVHVLHDLWRGSLDVTHCGRPRRHGHKVSAAQGSGIRRGTATLRIESELCARGKGPAQLALCVASAGSGCSTARKPGEGVENTYS